MKIHVFKHQYDALEFIEHDSPNNLVGNFNEHLQHRKGAPEITSSAKVNP